MLWNLKSKYRNRPEKAFVGWNITLEINNAEAEKHKRVGTK